MIGGMNAVRCRYHDIPLYAVPLQANEILGPRASISVKSENATPAVKYHNA